MPASLQTSGIVVRQLGLSAKIASTSGTMRF
jgi:hypothetical protein